jgi:hypothetical protein
MKKENQAILIPNGSTEIRYFLHYAYYVLGSLFDDLNMNSICRIITTFL